MKTTSSGSTTPFPAVSEDDIREYAYHLYLQSDCIPGRDMDNWLEAKACLGECIPPSQSHLRLHRHIHKKSSLPVPAAKNGAAETDGPRTPVTPGLNSGATRLGSSRGFPTPISA